MGRLPDDQRMLSPSPKRVVIVDDSRSMRSWLSLILGRDPRLIVVGQAENAETARAVIRRTNPDVVTLDIDMPGMSGLDFLERIMRLRPLPVVMISGVTRRNSRVTVEALALGAVDCILKPRTAADLDKADAISARVYAAANSQVFALQATVPPAHGPACALADQHDLPLILIGASTGGVAALDQVLGDLHANGPPVVVVQHMPAMFLESFSGHLDQSLAQDVALVRMGEKLRPGQIRLACAHDRQTEITRAGRDWSCRAAPREADALHCPSVDSLYHSAVPHAGDVIAVLLTGLGSDGARGMLALRQAGAHTIGQNADTCVIYGMPRVAHELGAVIRQLPVQDIGAAINKAVQAHQAARIGPVRG